MKNELKVLSDYTLSDEEFEAKYPHKITDEYILDFLENVWLNKNRVLMEYMSRVAFKISSGEKLIPVFRKLIKEPWHKEHENLAMFFQFSVKDPNCVDDIVTAMHLQCNYWYDNGDAFIRKCAYVLGDLGTPYSKQKLQDLLSDSNEMIRKYALDQLKKIEDREQQQIKLGRWEANQ